MAIVQNNTDRFLALDSRSRSGGPGGTSASSGSNKLKKKSGHVRGATTTISNTPSLASAPHQRSMSDPDAFVHAPSVAAPSVAARTSRDQLASLATNTPPLRPREDLGEETPRIAQQQAPAYAPSFHSTAGPPPPPPRATFSIDVASPPPPRPPRLRSPSPMVGRPASSEGTPTSIAQALSTRTSSSSLRPHGTEAAGHSDPSLSPVDEKEP